MITKLKDKLNFEKTIIYLNGKYIHILTCIFIYCFSIFSPFLNNERWINDSYCVSMFGYGYMWNSKRMIQQGRPISHFYYWLLDYLNVPFNITVFFSAFASLIFLSLASYFIFYTINKYVCTEKSGKYSTIILFIGCISIFFNMFFLESFLFLENSIMSLGVLLTALSSCFFMKEGKNRFVISLLLLIGGVFCYQADVAYFLPLVIIILYSKYRSNIKLIFKEFIVSLFIYFTALISNYCFIRVCVTLLGTNDTRIVGNIDIVGNLRRCILTFLQFAVNHFEFTPNFVYTAIIVILFAFLIYHVIREKSIATLPIYLSAFAILGICSLLPHVLMSNFYIMPRSFVAISSIGGLIILSIAVASKKLNAFTAFICICYMIFLSQKQIDIQMNHYANYKLDNQEITNIVNRIWDYEEQNSVLVDDIYISFSEVTNTNRDNIKNYRDITGRVLTQEWMVHPLLNSYLQRDYSENYIEYKDFEMILKSDLNSNIKEEKYSDKNLDGILNYHMVFIDATLYICIC